MKIAIGCPTAGPPTWKLVQSLVGLAPTVGQAAPFIFSRAEGQAPDEARNYIIRWFLEQTDADRLLFVDRDAILHSRTAERLASWNLDIVGALCFTRYRPPVPTVYRGLHPDPEREGDHRILVSEVRDWLARHETLQTWEPAILDPAPADSLIEVDFTGGHCLMVSRQALESIEPPWFKAYNIDPERLGEDRYFCEKARRLGFGVYVDLSVIAGHMYGEGSLGALDFMVWDSCMDWDSGNWNIPPKQDGRRVF